MCVLVNEHERIDLLLTSMKNRQKYTMKNFDNWTLKEQKVMEELQKEDAAALLNVIAQ